MNTEDDTTNLSVPYLSKRNQTLFDVDLIPVHDPNKERISAVFDHWVKVCRPEGRPPILDDRRKRFIVKGLKTYDVDTLKKAIDGAKASPFHQGENERGKIFDELTLILRDAEHIEQFVEYIDVVERREKWLDE